MASVRAQIITRQKYNRPLSEGIYETWEETIDRVIGHQRWLWQRVGKVNEDELQELRALFLSRKTLPAGRTLWLGGTELAKQRESTNFNCSFLKINTVHDVVDAYWLLLQGCGVGFKMDPGVLNGFSKPLTVEVIPSTRSTRGNPKNAEWFEGTTWHIQVGDSAEAWAKAVGKLLAQKRPASKLVLDFSQIRPAGWRLSQYGWISSGDATLRPAMVAIAELLNKRAGQLLTKIDILDIVNHLGTTLSSRRSAEIALIDYGSPEWEDFALAKKDCWQGNVQRYQSNNSLLFHEKPSKRELKRIFDMMVEGGGSEPGLFNMEHALKRAPYAAGTNPCGEVLLGNRSMCNLCEINIAAFKDNEELERAIYITARANYRQTCVNFKDGILQDAWHELNQFLRLTGVGLTGVVLRNPSAEELRRWREVAHLGVHSMADELGLPRSKNVTLGKPSGCRPYDALVTAKEGILTLEEIFASRKTNDTWEPVGEPLTALQDGGANKITKTFFNGEAEVFRITMSYGLEVESTSNHPWWVEGQGWVETRNLTSDMILKVEPGIYKSTNCAPLIDVPERAYKMRKDSVTIKQPKEMNADLAWLLGYLWGDGAMSPSKWRIRFIDGNKAVIENAARIFKEQFNLDASVVQLTDRKAYSLSYASSHLWHWLLRNGIYKYNTNDSLDHIPEVVRRSSTEHIIAFFAGLIDADANVSIVSKNKASIILATAYREFGVHAQNVAWAVGLAFGRSHNTKGQNLQKEKSIYLMTLSAKTTPEAGECLIKYSIKCQNLNGGRWPWVNPQRADFVAGKIKGVESIGTMETYDVEVENDHYFYAGAIKSHNTASKIMDTTEGCHMPLGEYIFNNVNFSNKDPLLEVLARANYKVWQNPTAPDAMLVTLPVSWPGLKNFDESAIEQLERYKLLMENYVDHNCFSGTQRFLTKEKGLAAFNEFKDGDVVNVVSKDGTWTPATVRQYGQQEIWEIDVERAGTKMTIETTGNHDWPITSPMNRLDNRKRTVKTSELLSTKLRNLISTYQKETVVGDPEAIMHGIVFGDGSIYNKKSGNLKAQVYLVGDKRQLKSYFVDAGYTVVERDDINQTRIYGLPSNWKTLPNADDTPEYLMGFLMGWFATDGSVSGNSATICSVDKGNLEWLQQITPRIGLAVSTAIKEQVFNTTYKKDVVVYRLTLFQATLPKKFYVLQNKTLPETDYVRHWKILDVRRTGRVEYVYCVEEPKDHLFVIEGNILTGNCSITVNYKPEEVDDIMAWLLRNWDSYVGVSFLPRSNETYAYMPQEVVDKDTYERYVSQLQPVNLDNDRSEYSDVDTANECATGACPIR